MRLKPSATASNSSPEFEPAMRVPKRPWVIWFMAWYSVPSGRNTTCRNRRKLTAAESRISSISPIRPLRSQPMLRVFCSSSSRA